MNMKSLRVSALMLALGAFSISSIPAHAQQEVNPDHFDQSSATSTQVRGSNTQNHQSAAPAHRLTNKKLASAESHQAHHALDNSANPAAPIHVTDPPEGSISPVTSEKSGAMALRSENTIVDIGTVLPPIIIDGPTAPKKPQPVAPRAQNTIADASSTSVPPVVIRPVDPRKPRPVAHDSESATA
jgi:hypothetical protein